MNPSPSPAIISLVDDLSEPVWAVLDPTWPWDDLRRIFESDALPLVDSIARVIPEMPCPVFLIDIKRVDAEKFCRFCEEFAQAESKSSTEIFHHFNEIGGIPIMAASMYVTETVAEGRDFYAMMGVIFK